MPQSLSASLLPRDVSDYFTTDRAPDFSFMLDDADREELETARDARAWARGFHLEDAPE